MFFVVLGLGIMRVVGMVKYEYIGKLSSIMLGLMVILLIVTMFTGQTIDGASASRWLKIPEHQFHFSHHHLLFDADYLSVQIFNQKITRERLPIENIMYIFGPILLVFVW
jgi:cell division protein FtsW